MRAKAEDSLSLLFPDTFVKCCRPGLLVSRNAPETTLATGSLLWDLYSSAMEKKWLCGATVGEWFGYFLGRVSLSSQNEYHFEASNC